MFLYCCSTKFPLKGIVRRLSSPINCVEFISEKKILFTGIKTDRYFPRYRRKTAPLPENSPLRFLSSLRKLFPPVTSILENICLSHKNWRGRMWMCKPGSLVNSQLLGCHWGWDLSAFQLTPFRPSNCFFKTWHNAIIGCRFFGK